MPPIASIDLHHVVSLPHNRQAETLKCQANDRATPRGSTTEKRKKKKKNHDGLRRSSGKFNADSTYECVGNILSIASKRF